jgi:4-amino-4-deoxy-L-arabinose transferase-like glycosyltransferase
MAGTSVAFPRGRVIELVAPRLRARWLPFLPLAGVVALSFVLNTWSLSVAGYGNTYYAAAVRSMTMSWSNFFFGAFDPGGFSTVDKPPVFLWVGALSARVFGYSTWSMLLPSAVAGAASVGLLWLIVRRYFGVIAATIAGLVLALTPVSVAVNRLNLPEPFMILALVGAAAATLQSIESRRWWAWTVVAGFLVGVAFNTKMLAAWIPGPAFAVALVVATRTLSGASLRQLLMRLAVLGVVTLAVSASWMFVVDAWPASARPYVGGSTNNTVLDLALGYNGFGRVDGTNQIGGGGAPRPAAAQNQFQRPPGGAGGPARVPSAAPGGNGQAAPPTGGARGFAGPGGIFGGLPGAFRMFDAANGGQIGWLLPFAVGGGLLAFWRWRHDPARRASAVLFLGWIGLYGGVFSYAHGIFHSYYTSAMAPGVAALAGVGSVALADVIQRDKRWTIVLAGVLGITVWTQLQIAGRTPDFYTWVRPLTIATAVSGAAAVAALAVRGRPVMAGLALSVTGLLLLPAAWSISASANASLNATLPQAGPQVGASAMTFGSLAFDDGTPQLAAWLKSHSDANTEWDLVVPSSQSGSRLIAQYALSVMSLGGFLGRDNAISVSGFADLVAAGRVRYVMAGQGGLGGRGGGFRGSIGGSSTSGPTAVLTAVQRACKAVTDPSLPAAYQGGLYDCGGAASALRQ